jgi:hypothetical protein
MTASPDSRVSLAPSPSRSRAPDFFIVGHHKCGTTALYEMLRRHPQIFMPELKEPWFFASDLPARFPATTPLPQTFDEYLSLFADATSGQRIGEATPSYLMSHAAAANIAQAQPDARIIAILREPASFLRSLHLQAVENHAETETDLGKALALEERRRRGEAIPREAMRPQELLYSEHVRYVEQLHRYDAVFAPEQILILIYDDFRRDNEAAVRRVLRFLQVDDSSPVEPVEVNPTVRVRSQRLYALLRSLYMGSAPTSRVAKAAIKGLTPKQLRLKAVRTTRRRILYDSPPAPDERLMLELRRRFKDEVVALSDYLGRDMVAFWGYDKLG